MISAPDFPLTDLNTANWAVGSNLFLEIIVLIFLKFYYFWKVQLITRHFRLAETKSSVVQALADDFDTPQAISAMMNLVYHSNCQLQPISKVTRCVCTSKHNLMGKKQFVFCTCTSYFKGAVHKIQLI